MDTKRHEKFKPKFRLPGNLAGRNVQTMKLDNLQSELSFNW
jgi:hypothetical protein